MPRSGPQAALRDRISLDNRFRLSVSWASLLLATILGAQDETGAAIRVALVVIAYSVPVLAVWFALDHLTSLRPMIYALSVIDFAAMTAVVFLTGGLTSPFIYLFPVPFLIHAFHFDVPLLIGDAVLASLGYAALIVSTARHAQSVAFADCAGQVLLLAVVITATLATSTRLRRKEERAEQSRSALSLTVRFLERLNSVSPTLPSELLQKELVNEVAELLKPLGIYARLWVVNPAWKTLQGLGEHPALRPGSPNHLPIVACPAFALRRGFRYDVQQTEPCVSEKFNYAKHLCMPLLNDTDCRGVLFAASYHPKAWTSEEMRLFEMLAHSIGLILQRKSMFEALQEKISELNFSVEVGAMGLATFLGSTQSIDETTVNILDGVRSILKLDRASLMIWDSQDERLQTQWVRGGDFKVRSPLRLAIGEGLAGWSLQCGQPYWAEYATGDPHYVVSSQPIRSLVCVPIFTMNGKPLGVINGCTEEKARTFDARELNFLRWFGKQASLAIENAQLHHRSRTNIDQLNEVNRMKSDFFSLVSHDLRGPLTGVRGFCEVLKEEAVGPLTNSQRELLSQLERQVDLQERMVDDLLDFARMEKARLSIIPESVNLNEVLCDEVNKAQMEARERLVTLRLKSIAEEVSQTQADGARIRQVIWNLLHNAMKFTPEGGTIEVESRIEKDRFYVWVRDNGIGLSQEAQDKIFDKFFQVSPGGSKGAQGLGLGLAICREIVIAHHGEIRASSPGLGQGTTFSFSLPLSESNVQRKTSLAA